MAADDWTLYFPTSWQAIVFYSLLVVTGIWLYTALLSNLEFPSLHDCHVLLLIAHPDDEAMFFSPTVSNLTNLKRRNVVKLLCLSSGNADGLGNVRQKELVASAKLLGIDPSHVVCLDEPALQDGMKNEWPSREVQAVLARYLLPSDYALGGTLESASSSIERVTIAKNRKAQQQTQKDAAPPLCHADVIVTFDRHGVSSHSNHIALWRGARDFAASLQHAHPGWACPVSVYALTSVSILRKYLGVADVALSLVFALLAPAWYVFVSQRISSGRSAATAATGWKPSRDRPSWLLFVSGPYGIRRGQKAMYAAHVSQMRWFRWGWITLGRYMAVNDLQRVA